MAQIPFARPAVNEEVIRAKAGALQAFLKHYEQPLAEDDIRNVVLSVLLADSGIPAGTVEEVKTRAGFLRAQLDQRGASLSLQKCLEGYSKFANRGNWSTYSAALGGTSGGVISNAVQMLTGSGEGYECITTRFGEWIEERGPVTSGLHLSDWLESEYEDHYSDTEPKLMEGDPRNFMGESEMTFVVEYKGKVGILVEIELAYVADNETDRSTLENGTDDFGSILVSTDEFAAIAEANRQRVQAFIDGNGNRFDKTTFFLADGFKERLCICAFTPLVETVPRQYASPYGARNAVVQIEDELLKLVNNG